MLLLDHNLPHQLRSLLAEFGIEAETTHFREWEQLRNGELFAAAHFCGFEAIFTHDRKFGESASKSLARFPTLAIFVIELSQRSWKNYSEAFRKAWEAAPVIPQSGKVVFWP
jgi:predicted nuclease of predicted toxin-antitoxin system